MPWGEGGRSRFGVDFGSDGSCPREVEVVVMRWDFVLIFDFFGVCVCVPRSFFLLHVYGKSENRGVCHVYYMT